MRGSWAGAMGQVQFLPSAYLRAAVDADGDGRRDIWASVPDSLASIANFIRLAAGSRGLPWGAEVVLPADFDLSRYRAPLRDFAARGVRRTDGKPLVGEGEASLFLPGGVGGPVFVVTANFEAIRAYNTSDAYALAVGHLAERIAGSAGLAAPWPVTAPRLDGAGIRALQEGFCRDAASTTAPSTAAPARWLREALAPVPDRRGLPADGYASRDAGSACAATPVPVTRGCLPGAGRYSPVDRRDGERERRCGG